MGGQPRLIPPDWPRAMRKSTAAAYLDLSESAFQRAVDNGDLPAPFTLGGKPMWSRPSLDERCELLAGESAYDWRKHSKLYQSLADRNEP